ncbi:MAG: DNA-protecting protein DprA [Chloroflexaceae bacterium]|nr:DNA-protecting protein DprA [Chloroflexaceae bacterium]
MTFAPYTQYYLGFNLVPGIGPLRLARLIERCGSVEAAWQASAADLLAVGIDARSSAALAAARQQIDLESELERIAALGVRLVALEDPDYPALLAQLETAPPLLYVRGDFTPTDEWAIAVVGTRSPTSYGKEATRHIVGTLARRGVTIISGLALGIDSVAHEVALEAGGRTIGVLGCGIDLIYPERNRALAERMMQQGAVISDYPVGTRPLSANFPPRNRIISGLARGVLVVEAGEKSGALITVEFALQQGREVFAVPGSIFNRTSHGTHRLIRNGAALVAGAEDILEVLNMTAAPIQQEIALALPDDPDDPTEATLLAHMSGEPQHVDVLTRASGLPAAKVSAALAMLELKGYVRQVAAMEYVRAR